MLVDFQSVIGHQIFYQFFYGMHLLILCYIYFYREMIVKKIINSQRKQLSIKQPYKKPTYKSYRELLHLDRPKNRIQYQSESQEEDFLQKLLNQQKKKKKQSKKRKSKELKSNNNIENLKQQSSHLEKQKFVKFVEPKQEYAEKQKYILNNNSLKLSQIREEPSKLSVYTIQKNKNRKEDEMNNKAKQKLHNDYHQMLIENRQSLISRATIYIDNNSIECPPLVNHSHTFYNTLNKRSISPYIQLLEEKDKFMNKVTRRDSLPNLKDQEINHCLERQFQTRFTFSPNIEPLNPHWRSKMIIDRSKKPEKRILIKKDIFKSKQEEYRFIKSLKELSKFKEKKESQLLQQKQQLKQKIKIQKECQQKNSWK